VQTNKAIKETAKLVKMKTTEQSLSDNAGKVLEANREPGSFLSSAEEERGEAQGQDAGIKRRPDPFGNPACGEHMERRR